MIDLRKRLWIWVCGGLALLVVTVGCVVLLRYWVGDVAFDVCIEGVSGATPSKCGCVARRMAERMVTPQYVYRRITRDEGVPKEEVDEIRKTCGLP